MLRLDGKTALVTGASQGIGEAIARRLAAQGARLVLCARSEEKLESLAEELRQGGGEAHALPLDLGQPASLADRLKQLSEPFDSIDILINNAGVTADKLLARMTLEDWHRVLEVGLTGVYALTRQVARGMVRRRWGRIVTISSVVGLMGNPGQSNYAAAKAGQIGFSKSLARELGSRNITVNVVAPGYVETSMTAGLPEDVRKEMFGAIPLKRFGSVDDIAWPVLFLASEEGGYITGHVLNVSGGLYV